MQTALVSEKSAPHSRIAPRRRTPFWRRTPPVAVARLHFPVEG